MKHKDAEIVKFSTGEYAIRSDIKHRGVRYLDLKSMNYGTEHWWDKKETYWRDCLSKNIKHVEDMLIKLKSYDDEVPIKKLSGETIVDMDNYVSEDPPRKQSFFDKCIEYITNT